MKNLLSRLSLVVPALLMATQASAHPSGHATLSTMKVFSHLFASPYHFGMTVSVLILIAFIVRKVSSYAHVNQSK